jgi:ribosomal protein S4E
MVAIRWYLRYSLSYRDVEELLAKRGVMVDQISRTALPSYRLGWGRSLSGSSDR